MGFVANFPRLILAMQIFQNQLRSDEITESLKGGLFETQCSLQECYKHDTLVGIVLPCNH